MDTEIKTDRECISGHIRDLKQIEIMKVCKTPMEATWDYLVRTYHYLGCKKIIGPRIKYLVFSGGNPIAAISYNGASKYLEVRDTYIGWDKNQRKNLLPHILNNNRLLILPWIKVKNLASHLISRTLRMLRTDWKKAYGVTPHMVETFVELERHTGVCYRAANWLYLGETKGFGKAGKTLVYHGRHKGVFVYLMKRNWIAQIRSAPGHQPLKLTEERGQTLMILQQMDWNPGLLNEAGVTQENVATLGFMLQNFMKRFTGCFVHSAQRLCCIIYVKGLLSNLERKSAEPMALRYVGSHGVRNLQYFTQKGAWDDDMMLQVYQEGVSEVISDPDGGMITIDGCDFPKKGKESVGVARQHCGPLGKVDNCQAGVYMGYSGSKGYALIEGHLYMPEKWFTDEYKERRIKCGVPGNIEFKTKIQIASDMLRKACESNLFLAKWVGVDSFFGRSHEFLDSIPKELYYFADIPDDTLVFTKRPKCDIPPYSGRGRKPVQVKPEFPPVSVKSIARDDSIPYKRVQMGIGSKGPIFSDVKCIRIVECRDGLPHHEVWLYIRRLSDGTCKFSLCNAPGGFSKEELDAVALMRWPIEQCFEECKSKLGMDHCESRSWNSFHRHILFVFIAHFFLLTLRFFFAKKNRF